MVNNITSRNNMNHYSVKPQKVMVNNITSYNNMNHSPVKPQKEMDNNITAPTIAVFHIAVVGYIVDHYCLMFDRGVVHIVVPVILLSINV
jgi:hypothetical protein